MDFFTPRLFDNFFFPFYCLFFTGIYASLKLSPPPPLGFPHWMSPVDTWFWDAMSMPCWGGTGLGGRGDVVVIVSSPPCLQLFIFVEGIMLWSYIRYRYWLLVCFMLSDVSISALLVLVQLRSVICTLYPP